MRMAARIRLGDLDDYVIDVEEPVSRRDLRL